MWVYSMEDHYIQEDDLWENFDVILKPRDPLNNSPVRMMHSDQHTGVESNA